MQPETKFALVMLAVLIVAVLAWLAAVYNDLARRRARIVALWASVKLLRGRRHGVARSLGRHLATAADHERRVAGQGARRGGASSGRRGGRSPFLRVSDNANGWPTATAVGTAERAMTADLASHDRETAAWQLLYQEAQAYNARIASFPRLLLAPTMGFRPWRFAPPGPSPRGRRARRDRT